jgi:hypothetical protein
MLPIQPRRRRQCDEELTTIRIRSAVRHAQDARARMLQRRADLIFEFLAIDRGAATARACWVAGLDHEIGDYAVEDQVVEVATFGEGREVSGCLKWSVRRWRSFVFRWCTWGA